MTEPSTTQALHAFLAEDEHTWMTCLHLEGIERNLFKTSTPAGLKCHRLERYVSKLIISWIWSHNFGTSPNTSKQTIMPQTELAMRGSNGIGKGPWKVTRWSSFILIRKNAYLVTLALVSPTRNRRSRAQTPIFMLENQHILVQMAQVAWSGPSLARGQILKIWGPGNPAIWGPKSQKDKNFQNPNPFCQKCRQGLD